MSRGVGPGWDSEASGRAASPLVRRLIAVGIALVLIAPSAAAADKGPKQNPRKYVGSCQGDNWRGVQDNHPSRLYRVCYRYNVDPPTGTGSSNPTTAGSAECPDRFEGFILDVNNTGEDTQIGACVLVDYALPEDPHRHYPTYDTDLESCQVPDSQRNGTDPVIEFYDGYVLFCIIPIVDPGDPDRPFEVSTEPCEPGASDPEIRIGNGGAQVCLDYHVLGLSYDIPERTV